MARTGNERETPKYEEVLRELASVKQEIIKLKLDISRALKEKTRADAELEASTSRTQSLLQSYDELTREIEEVNEELVLVELAKFEAIRELAVAEAQRNEECEKFSSLIQEKRQKIGSMLGRAKRAKQLDKALAETNSEIEVLQKELDFIKEIEAMSNVSPSSQRSSETDVFHHEDVQSPAELDAIESELQVLHKELASQKERVFQSMTSLDEMRKELRLTSGQVARLKKRELKDEKVIERLHTELLRAQDKLKAANASEATAKAILSSMSAALDQMKTRARAAEDDRELTLAEAENTKRETEEIDLQTDLAEEQVQAAIQELEEVKLSESVVLEKLKVLAQIAARSRAKAAKSSPVITISKFEYEYLRGSAASAKEIADRKVEAAKACIEVLQMSQDEMVTKIERAQRELTELSLVEEEREVQSAEKSLTVQELFDVELQGKRERDAEDSDEYLMELPRKSSIKADRDLADTRTSKNRKSTTHVGYTTRASFVTLRRRRKIMLNVVKCFAGKRIVQGPVLQAIL